MIGQYTIDLSDSNQRVHGFLTPTVIFDKGMSKSPPFLLDHNHKRQIIDLLLHASQSGLHVIGLLIFMKYCKSD